MESLKLLVSLIGGHVLPEEAEGPARRTRIAMLAAIAATVLASVWGVAVGSTAFDLAAGNLWKVPLVLLLSSLLALPAGLLAWRVARSPVRAGDLLTGIAAANLTGALVLAVLAPLVALYYHTSGWLGGVLAIAATVFALLVGGVVFLRAVVLRAEGRCSDPTSRLRLGAPMFVLVAVYMMTIAQLIFLVSPILPETTVFDGGADALLGS